MGSIINIAVKDLRVLYRDKMALFFVFGFPILMGVFFGVIMGGTTGGSSNKMNVAIVDNDRSEFSKKFVDALGSNESLNLETSDFDSAAESVRKGKRVAVVVLEPGFGKTAGVFWEEAPEVKIGRDESRGAETAMLQGFVMEAMGSLVGERFQNPKQFLGSIQDSKDQIKDAEGMNALNRQLLLGFLGSAESLFDSMDQLQSNGEGDGSSVTPQNIQFANIKKLDIDRERLLNSKWDISFPQAMVWGILGCIAGFSISIAQERTKGTMYRLQVAPISNFHILAGKALACFLTTVAVIVMMTVLGVMLGMNPSSYPKLAMATLSIAFGFVGIMMTFATLGKSEQSVSGIGWAINMVFAMIGGAMIPVMFMPGFLQKVSVISPVKWSISALEGAIWRRFSYAEMLLPCSIMVGVGVVGIVIGTVILSKRKI